MALKFNDLKDNTVAELEKKLRETRESLLSARLSKQTGQLEKPHLLQEYRRDIARISTALSVKKASA